MQSDVENRPSGPTEKKTRTLNLTRARELRGSPLREGCSMSRTGGEGRAEESRLSSRGRPPVKKIYASALAEMPGGGFFAVN